MNAQCTSRRGRGTCLKRYLKSTGSTGAPATNAPVEKVSRQCTGLVVPSGATVNSGYLQSLPAGEWKPTYSSFCAPQVSRQCAGLTASSGATAWNGDLQRCLSLTGRPC